MIANLLMNHRTGMQNIFAFSLAMATTAVTSSAAILSYPAQTGTHVTYSPISESSNTDAVPLYGTPSVSGDSLLFRNMNFNSNSINGSPAIDFTDGQLNFTLTANSGTLNTLKLSEFGDYNVSATPSNPAAINFVKVYPQAVQITVLAEGGVPLATPLVDNTSVVMTLSPSGGDFQTGVDPSTGSWAGLATANLSALFGANNITQVAISFDNQLLAESQVGGIATISKKGFTVDPVVPEPTMISMAIGAGALMLRRRVQKA